MEKTEKKENMEKTQEMEDMAPRKRAQNKEKTHACDEPSDT
jgi:hypothetical protein